MREVSERQHWLEMVEIGRECAEKNELDAEIHDSFVKLKVPGFDGQTIHEAYLDLYDYGQMTCVDGYRYGAYYVRQSFGHQILAANRAQKNREFNNSATYVHTIITDKQGFRHFRNGNTLDCRRANLVTDNRIRTEVPPEIIETEDPNAELIEKELAGLHRAFGMAPEG